MTGPSDFSLLTFRVPLGPLFEAFRSLAFPGRVARSSSGTGLFALSPCEPPASPQPRFCPVADALRRGGFRGGRCEGGSLAHPWPPVPERCLCAGSLGTRHFSSTQNHSPRVFLTVPARGGTGRVTLAVGGRGSRGSRRTPPGEAPSGFQARTV